MVFSLDCPSSASSVVTHHDLVELAQYQSRERPNEGSDPSLPSDVDALELEECIGDPRDEYDDVKCNLRESDGNLHSHIGAEVNPDGVCWG